MKHEMEITLPSDNTVILDHLWELARAHTRDSKAYDLSEYFKGGFKWIMKVAVDTSYVVKDKEYQHEEFSKIFMPGLGFTGKRLSHKRKVTLTATISVIHPINDSIVDDTELEAVFYLNHKNTSDNFLGLMLHPDWDTANLTLNARFASKEDDYRRKQKLAVISTVGQKIKQANTDKQNELVSIFAKVKI